MVDALLNFNPRHISIHPSIHPSIHQSINQSINQSYIEEGLLFCPDLFVGDCVDDSLLSEVFVALSVYCKSILMNKYLL